MKDEKNFIKSWEEQRQKGKLKYVLNNAGKVVAYGLGGVIFGSIFLYNSPSSYSFKYYLPTYFFIAFLCFLGGMMRFMYKWHKNEKRYSNLLD